MRISDWSSDVCSSDLRVHHVALRLAHLQHAPDGDRFVGRGVHGSAVGDLFDLFGEQPPAGGVLVGFVADHALGEQPVQRSGDAAVPDLPPRTDNAPRVKQNQDSLVEAYRWCYVTRTI